MFFNKKNPRRTRTPNRRFGIEAMEAKRLLAADVSFAADVVPEVPRDVTYHSAPETAQSREHILLAGLADTPAGGHAEGAYNEDSGNITLTGRG